MWCDVPIGNPINAMATGAADPDPNGSWRTKPPEKRRQFGFPTDDGEKNGQMVVSGRICLYVACYDFVLGFNVSSSPLMFFQVGFWG